MTLDKPRRPYRVWGFASTHDAIAAEDVLKRAGLSATTVPRPAEIGGAECGISVRVPHEDEDRASMVLQEAGIHVIGGILVMDRPA